MISGPLAKKQMKNLVKRYVHWNWALLDQALVSGSNFVVGVLLVRYIGMDQYGRFILAWMLVQFFASVQNALILSPMLSISPKIAINERANYFSATLLLQAGLILLIAALWAIYSSLLKQYGPASIEQSSNFATVLCVLAVQAQEYMRRCLYAQISSRRAFYLDLVAYGVQIPLIPVVLRAYASFEAALLVTGCAMMFAVLTGCRWFKITMIPKASLRKTARRHWHSSRWLLGSAILQWLSGNYFMVTAGLFLGPPVVGAIRAAQNLLGVTHVFFQGLENVVPGEASHRYQDGGPKALLQYVGRIALLLLAGTALIAIGVVILVEPLLRLVYATFDQVSAQAIRWFAPLYLLVAITLPLRAALRTLESTGAVFIAYIASALFALTASEYFVRHYAVVGVMVGMISIQVIVTCVLSMSMFLELRRRWNLSE